jgi:hypothetical protein
MPELKVKIGSDVRGFKRGVAAVKGQLKRLGGSVAGAVGMSVGAAGFAMFTKQLIDSADQIGKVSKRLGVTAEEYQKLQFAAERSGASQGAVEKGMRRMAATVYDAGKGLSTAKMALSDLGLSYKDLEGKSPERQFAIIAERLNLVKDASLKSALAQRIFGRSGTELIPMIGDYSKLADEIERSGGLMSNEAVAAAERFKDSMTNMGTTIKAALANSGLLEWLADVVDRLDKTVKYYKWLENRDPANGISRENAEKLIEEQIERDYAKNPAFKKQYEKIVESYARGQGLGGKLKNIAYKLAPWFTGDVNHNDPRQMAFNREKEIRLQKMGFDSGSDYFFSAPTKKEISNAAKKRPQTVTQSAEILSGADYESAMTTMQKESEAEEKRQNNAKKYIEYMKHQIRLQKLINEGKKEQSEYEAEVYRAKQRGVEITPEISAAIKQKLSMNNDGGNTLPRFNAPASVTDSMLRIGGYHGGQANISDIPKQQLQKLAKIENKVESLDMKTPYPTANNSRQVFR